MVSELRFKPMPPELPKPLSEAEISRILDLCPSTLEGIRDRAIIETLYCGLRNNEICSGTLKDLSHRELSVIGKGSKPRIVPLSEPAWNYTLDYVLMNSQNHSLLEIADYNGKDAALGVLMSLTPPKTPLFFSNEGLPLYPRAVRRITEKYGRLAGVKNAHPHRFRHSFATHLLDNGLDDILSLRNVMGHSSLDTTRLYVQVSKKSRDRVMRFHPRNR
jgi:site-specific recombinase XerD